MQKKEEEKENTLYCILHTGFMDNSELVSRILVFAFLRNGNNLYYTAGRRTKILTINAVLSYSDLVNNVQMAVHLKNN